MSSQANRPRLHVDATVAVPDARGTVTVVFGPFSDHAAAERALTAFMGRENAMGAIIRDPDPALATKRRAEVTEDWIHAR